MGRDNFPDTLKIKLAQRVGYLCSFPGCNTKTVGPGSKDSQDVLNIGEAAHITAASPNGPRYNADLTSAQRKSIDNAIWMCRIHAKIIDSDADEYSVATLKKWKVDAEKNAQFALQKTITKNLLNPYTLVSLGHKVIFIAQWKTISNHNWRFRIIEFMEGNMSMLRDFLDNKDILPEEKFFIDEGQGDARLLKEEYQLELVNDNWEIEISVQNRFPTVDPNNVGGDIAISNEGLIIENGDFKIITGIDCAKQIIQNTLGGGWGDSWFNPKEFDYFSFFFWKYRANLTLLNQMLKLEITRLVNIPPLEIALWEPEENKNTPPLNFIKRILEVNVLSTETEKGRIPISIKLEWGNGTVSKDTYQIWLSST